MVTLTARQKDILVLHDALEQEGLPPPTAREICSALGMSHTSGAYAFKVRASLQDAGLLTRAERGGNRTIRVTNHGRSTARRILRDNPWPLVPEAFDTPDGTSMLPVYEWHVGDVAQSVAVSLDVERAHELELASA